MVNGNECLDAQVHMKRVVYGVWRTTLSRSEHSKRSGRGSAGSKKHIRFEFRLW